MASSDASWNARLQRSIDALKTNATAQAVCEAVAAIVLVGEAGALMWWHGALAAPVQVLLWAQIVATAACLRWAGLFPLFGPVLVYDLVRSARRSRYFYNRVLYASLLSIMLFWGFFMEYSEAARHGGLRNNDLAQFSSGFFYAYMIVQFSVVVLLTPAYTAGAIAEEKDRKTLPFLLATDLRDREIILGKLTSRLLNLTLFVLTGLPILSFLQFMGGVDPGLLLAGFAATGLTMLGLGSLSMFNSVLTRRARDAIIMTYVEAFAYVALSGASWLLLLIPGAATFPNFGTWVSPVTVQDLVEWFNAGNLVAIMFQVSIELSSPGGRLDLLVPRLLRNYALFMSLLSVVALGWAILRMRPRALKEASDVPRQRRRLLPAWPRPRVGAWPMIWKEIYIERGLRLHWIARVFIGLLVIASFLPGLGIVWNYLDDRYTGYGVIGWRDPWRWFVEEMNVWARVVGTGIFCLMMLAVAVRAAGSISGERDKGTLNDLLATPLGSDAILFSKWLGSLLSVRWAWLWLVLVWMVAGLATALHPVAVPVMVVAWFVYAAFLACLGLWFSMVCRSTLRAIVWTLITGGLFFVGHFLIWLLFIPFFMGGMPREMEWLAKFEFGLTPPFALGGCFPILLFQDDHGGMFGHEWVQMFFFGLVGIVFWGAAALILWGVVSARFREMTNRSRYGRIRVVRTAPHPRLRSTVVSRNGVASHPLHGVTKPENVEALPAGPDGDSIVDVLRVEDPPPEG